MYRMTTKMGRGQVFTRSRTFSTNSCFDSSSEQTVFQLQPGAVLPGKGRNQTQSSRVFNKRLKAVKKTKIIDFLKAR
jgi:hypothetical protein